MITKKETFLPTYRPEPFIGHSGFGTTFCVSNTYSSTIIKMSFRSHMLKILSLMVMGPLLTLIMTINWPMVMTKPVFILGALSFFNLIGWIFFIKFLAQFIGGRRIEFRHSDHTILFYKFGNKVHNEIRADEISEVFIKESFYHTSSRVVPNFTIVLRTKNGSTWDLATSEEQATIVQLKSLLSAT